MKKHLSKTKVQFKFFFLYFLISNLHCNDIYIEKIYDNIKVKQIKKDNKEDKTLNLELEYGNVYNLDLFLLKSTNIKMKKKDKYHLLVHFYPLDCKIYIDEKKSKDKIQSISNYNYDAFYVLINKDNDFSSEVRPLIYPINEENKNITCPLILNSVPKKDNEVPELVIKEKLPILFYFNDNTTNLKLIYNHDNNGNPIIVSFFIKEKARFRIECNDGEEKINKIIYYKETILIKPHSSNIQYNILITRIDQVNSTMIIKASGNNSSSFYLQKNILNLGFIPQNEKCQYYYMKVYKGQEGEILLNNKRLNGMLISKIINKNDDISNIKIYPGCQKNINLSNDNYLQFDEYNKKTSFNSNNTKDCKDNCYLLVTYYSDQHNNNINITGNEYTLLTRVWDEDDFISQLINVPLNEFIFGSMDNTSYNVHFYSVFIPEDSDNITIEIHGENTVSYAKKGVKKINAFKITDKEIQLNKKLREKEIININKKDLDLDSFKGQYISFAFKKGDDDEQSYYYFRILQPNINNITIYPLDSNKESLCQTKIFNGSNSCYFLLKNENKELSNTFVFYGYGKDEINSKIYCFNKSDDYSIDLNNLNLIENNERAYGYIKYEGGCENSAFVLVKTISKENETISFVSNFYHINELDNIFDIYSYQLFYLENDIKTFFYINQTISNKYRIFIINIGGIGYLKSNDTAEKKDSIKLEGRNKTYSFSNDNEIQIKNISFYSKVNLAFIIKMNYQRVYDFMDELDCQYNKRDIINKVNEQKFPIIYFLKDIKNEGMDINLIFKFKDDSINNNGLIIKGGFIDYNDFKNLEEKDDVEYYLKYPFNGIYSPIMNTGLIIFNKELIEDIKTKIKHDNIYQFILIDKNENIDIDEFSLEINVIPKNDSQTFLIENKYAQCSFNLSNKTIEYQKYFIDKATVNEKKFYLEISSNYKDAYLEFNDKTNCTEKKTLGGVKRYYLSISSQETNDYFFIVKVNKSRTIKDLGFKVNINLIYYLEEKKIDVENFLNKFVIKYEQEDYSEIQNSIKLIIKNTFEGENTNNLTYFYYIGYINKKNIIENEILNTITPIFSNIEYLFENQAINISQSYNYEFICDIEQNYSASLFIKIVNESEIEKDERYYSFPLPDFSTKRNLDEINKSNEILIIIISFVIVIIIILIISFLYCRKFKKRNKNLEEKFRAISFSDGMEKDSSNRILPEKSKGDDEYENTFI